MTASLLKVLTDRIVNTGGDGFVADADTVSHKWGGGNDVASALGELLGNRVSSLLGRGGDVVASVGDYAASLIANDSTVAGASLKDALETIDATFVPPSMTSVCPALWPPWKRATAAALSVSRSTILPLPSSPHWVPTTTTFLPIVVP